MLRAHGYSRSRVWNVLYNPRPPIIGPVQYQPPPIPSPLISTPHFRPPTISSPPQLAPFPYQTPHPRPTILSPNDQYEAPLNNYNKINNKNTNDNDNNNNK